MARSSASSEKLRLTLARLNAHVRGACKCKKPKISVSASSSDQTVRVKTIRGDKCTETILSLSNEAFAIHEQIVQGLKDDLRALVSENKSLSKDLREAISTQSSVIRETPYRR